MEMKCFVTGCAGFIGSHLTDRLLSAGHDVVGYDNFSTGNLKFLHHAKQSPQFTLIKGDLLNAEHLINASSGCECVFHFAANADVRFGVQHPTKDLTQNTIATSHLLEAMRINRIPQMVFASTGSIYGEATIIPTPETAPFPMQTSFYGASKLAAEGLIQAYSQAFNIRASIYRFVSILGDRYSHGHVIDFYQQLLSNPKQLTILGNGQQRKSYLFVHDCIDAILLSMSDHTNNNINIFNLGTDEYCTVNDSVNWICNYLQVNPQLIYTGGERGWIGDNPFIFLDCDKIRQYGWQPQLSIRQAILKTIDYLRGSL